jgi:hypothetical protein
MRLPGLRTTDCNRSILTCDWREGKSVVTITRELGLHSRSYVHRQIQRQALELVTEAFPQVARHAQPADDER